MLRVIVCDHTTCIVNLASKADMGRDEKDLESWLENTGGTEEESVWVDADESSDELSELRNAVIDVPLTYGRIDLVPIATLQRKILILFAIMVSLPLIGLFVPDRGDNPFFLVPAILIFFACGALVHLRHFQLISALRSAGARISWASAIFGTIFLPVSLATHMLKAHGFKVGLFGVNPKLVKEAQKDGLLNIINHASRAKSR
jgi:hypothetical protein